MLLRIRGALPASMGENSGAQDWFGQLQLSSVVGSILGIDLAGPGALYLSASWDAASSTASFRPAAAVDYEAFAAAGLPAEIVFSLTVRLSLGISVPDQTVFRLAVEDRDDTPPTGLRFVSGGRVEAGVPGAVIGTLAVTDPDTPTPGLFSFSFADDDAWRFEVVEGGVLKLRDGISLGLDDIPLRPLIIGVSDGRQGAAFSLDLEVYDPGALPGETVLAPGETRGEVALPTPARALVLASAAEVESLAALAPGVRGLALAGRPEVMLPDTAGRIDFADGRLELDPAGPVAQVARLAQALGGDASSPTALARHVLALESGASLAQRATTLLGPNPWPASDAGFVEALLRGALGRAPDAAAVEEHLGRLAGGLSRAELAVDAALAVGGAPVGPLWLSLVAGRETPGPALPDPLAPAPPAPAFAAEWLLG